MGPAGKHVYAEMFHYARRVFDSPLTVGPVCRSQDGQESGLSFAFGGI